MGTKAVTVALLHPGLGAITRHGQPCGLKQQQFVLPQVWRPKVRDRVSATL